MGQKKYFFLLFLLLLLVGGGYLWSNILLLQQNEKVWQKVVFLESESEVIRKTFADLDLEKDSMETLAQKVEALEGLLNPKPFMGIIYEGVEDGTAKGVVPGSPAAKAGLKQGDIIVSFDGKKVDNRTSLQVLLSGKNKGEKVKLEILRNGKKETVELTLGDKVDYE